MKVPRQVIACAAQSTTGSAVCRIKEAAMKNVAFMLLCFTLLVIVAATAWAQQSDQCSGALPLYNINGSPPYPPSTATGCGALITVATVDPETGAATSFIVTIPNNGNG